MRRRDAPSDSRMPISRWRETPRASSRLATLAQPITRISPKAKNRGEKTSSASMTSTESVPWRGVSETWIGCPGSVLNSVRPDAHAARAAVAASGDSPGFSRPTTSIAISFSRPAEAPRNCPASASGAQIIGRSDGEAPKAVGHDADDLVRRAVDRHAAADHLPIAPEQLAPSRVAQHDHRPAGKPLVVSGQQRPPERGLDPQHLKEVAGDEACTSRDGPRCASGSRPASRRHQ